MNRRVLQNENHGERIYTEEQKGKNDDRNNEILSVQGQTTTNAQLQSKSYDCLTDSNLTKPFPPLNAKGSSECQTKLEDSGHLRKSQQVLDLLDWRLQILDESSRRASQVPPRGSIGSLNSNYCPTDIDIVKLLSDHSRISTQPSEELSLQRELLLDDYIRHKIDDTGECCGCHFISSSSSNNNSSNSYISAGNLATGLREDTDRCCSSSEDKEQQQQSAHYQELTSGGGNSIEKNFHLNEGQQPSSTCGERGHVYLDINEQKGCLGRNGNKLRSHDLFIDEKLAKLGGEETTDSFRSVACCCANCTVGRNLLYSGEQTAHTLDPVDEEKGEARRLRCDEKDPRTGRARRPRRRPRHASRESSSGSQRYEVESSVIVAASTSSDSDNKSSRAANTFPLNNNNNYYKILNSDSHTSRCVLDNDELKKETIDSTSSVTTTTSCNTFEQPEESDEEESEVELGNALEGLADPLNDELLLWPPPAASYPNLFSLSEHQSQLKDNLALKSSLSSSSFRDSSVGHCCRNHLNNERLLICSSAPSLSADNSTLSPSPLSWDPLLIDDKNKSIAENNNNSNSNDDEAPLIHRRWYLESKRHSEPGYVYNHNRNRNRKRENYFAEGHPNSHQEAACSSFYTTASRDQREGSESVVVRKGGGSERRDSSHYFTKFSRQNKQLLHSNERSSFQFARQEANPLKCYSRRPAPQVDSYRSNDCNNIPLSQNTILEDSARSYIQEKVVGCEEVEQQQEKIRRLNEIEVGFKEIEASSSFSNLVCDYNKFDNENYKTKFKNNNNIYKSEENIESKQKRTTSKRANGGAHWLDLTRSTRLKTPEKEDRRTLLSSSNSMRALVKDIAKCSLPSLSSLQYLPSQFERTKTNQQSGLRKLIKKRYTTGARCNMETKRPIEVSGGVEINRRKNSLIRRNLSSSSGSGIDNQVKVITESKEDLHHESCLLNRLCMCNCMAAKNSNHADAAASLKRSKSDNGSFSGQDNESSEKSSRGSSLRLRRKLSGKQSTNSSKKLRHTSESSSASNTATAAAKVDKLSTKSDKQSSKHQSDSDISGSSELRARSTDLNKARDNPKGDSKEDVASSDRQSPSFLSILKSSAHISHNSRRLSQQKSKRKAKGLVGSSVEDLGATNLSVSSGLDADSAQDAASERSSSSVLGRNTRSPSFGATSSDEPQQQPRAASVASAEFHSRTAATDPKSLSSNETTRAQSACSSRDSDKHPQQQFRGKKSTSSSSYKRFLSPSKLFGSRHNSRNNEAHDDYDDFEGKRRISSPESASANDKSHDAQQQQQSFLSRSLSRISQRAARFSPTANSRDSTDKELTKKREAPKENRRNKPEEEQQQESSRRPICVSPTISVSTVSHTRGSISDSINSLEEEVALPQDLSGSAARHLKSSSLLSPEVILERVELVGQQADDNMTRARSQSGSADRLRYRIKGHSNNFRCGSELSYHPSSDRSDRACSLPASPRGQRRRYGARSRQSPGLEQSPVPFRSPASESTKIEDGLKVCSSEHFEKHIGNIKVNQSETQKKLFKAWINHYCPNLIHRDLVEEFKDGIKLIGLLATLTHDKQLHSHYEKLNRDKHAYVSRLVITPSSRLRHLSNVSIAIDYLRKNLGMKLINLNPMDVVSGKTNVTLGLCWSIILNFQLEQNFLRHLESFDCSSISSSGNNSEHGSNCTSRLSSCLTNEDRSTKSDRQSRISSELDEYSTSDLVNARKKLLDHVNKRFNLKLTNLTSSLLDGDVLKCIIQHLAPADEADDEAAQRIANQMDKKWTFMDNDEKLDYCFELAESRLQVPRLFSANDLKQQSIADNNSKPLLVYLSMLLKNATEARRDLAVGATIDTLINDPSENSLPSINSDNNEISSFEARVGNCLNEIDRSDRFEVDKIQLTLSRIRELEKLMASEANREAPIDSNLVARFERLKGEAQQVESLISWINEADNLFETEQKSAADLTRAIEEYHNFFSSSRIKFNLCPTLERQYRECLGTAKQRILSMEQTLKNWDAYEKSRRQLKDWLAIAESKLANALRPPPQLGLNGTEDDNISSNQLRSMDLNVDRLEDLIHYFELEPWDGSDSLLTGGSPYRAEPMSTLNMNLYLRTPSLESVNSTGLLQMNESLSGSALSLGSNSSRLSTSLQSSRKATYNRLFDDFELKCRLLAAMLNSDQRDALLLGVRELRNRLRYITEQRVPQVISELRFNIDRCEMCILEEDEVTEQQQQESSQVEQDDDNEEEDDDEEATNEQQQHEDVGVKSSPIESPDILSGSDELEEEMISGQQEEEETVDPEPVADDLEADISSVQVHAIINNREEPIKKPTSVSTQSKQNARDSTGKSRKKANKKVANKNKDNVSKKQQNSVVSRQKQQPTSSPSESWSSMFSWLIFGNRHETSPKLAVKRSKSKKNKNNVGVTSVRPNEDDKSKMEGKTTESISSELADTSYANLFWHKLKRAYRASFSLNIVLLICLAGICIVPLVHRDACCELAQTHIPMDDFSIHEKPT